MMVYDKLINKLKKWLMKFSDGNYLVIIIQVIWCSVHLSFFSRISLEKELNNIILRKKLIERYPVVGNKVVLALMSS